MNREQAAPFLQQLLAQRASIQAHINQRRGGDISRAEAAAEHFGRPEDSPAQVATERDTEFALGEHDVAEVLAIDAALARIEAGAYGECTDCGIDIPAARLHAAPEAARCIHCQEKVEHQA